MGGESCHKAGASPGQIAPKNKGKQRTSWRGKCSPSTACRDGFRRLRGQRQRFWIYSGQRPRFTLSLSLSIVSLSLKSLSVSSNFLPTSLFLSLWLFIAGQRRWLPPPLCGVRMTMACTGLGSANFMTIGRCREGVSSGTQRREQWTGREEGIRELREMRETELALMASPVACFFGFFCPTDDDDEGQRRRASA